MKKFLSLVLALVMVMSLATVGAGAADDFSDSADIQYTEAVEVITAIGVMDGYEDESFGPTGGLSRGAAAKIICNLILGTTTASALVADTAPYPDVPVNNTFAGYIAYCKSQEIISGYADGTFKPSAPLSGYAFMKMLLGALGYQADKEGFVGPNWSVNVAKLALSIGLADDLEGDFTGVAPATREEAALYAFNTLTATMVEYPNDNTIIVGDLTVQGNAKASEIYSAVASASNFKALEISSGKYTLQFVEKSFPDVTATSTRDDFGRPAQSWYNDRVKIGTYVDEADLVYSGSVPVYQIYQDLGLGRSADYTSYRINGDTDDYYYYNATGVYNISKNNDNALKDLKDVAPNIDKVGNGTIIEVFERTVNTNEIHVIVCVISVYPGQITRVVDETAAKDAYVVVENLKGGSIPGFTSGNNDEFETEDFEEDQIVAFTYSETAAEIKTVEAIDGVEGKLTKRAIGSTITLDGTTYKYAKEYALESGLTENGLTNDSEYIVYLDANGHAIYVAETEFAVGNYALVTAITGGGGWNGNKAKLVFTDGTAATVDTEKDYTVGSTIINANEIVAFAKTSDGDYKLKSLAGDKALATDSTFTMSKATSNVTTGEGARYADSKTVFVVRAGGAGQDWKAYTGIKNAPSIAAAADNSVAYYCKDGNILSVVFVDANTAANVTQSSKDVIFVAGNSVSKKIIDADDNEYYTYNAVVNGEITTVDIAASSDGGSIAGLNNGVKANVLFNSVTKDGERLTNATQYAQGNGAPNVVNWNSYSNGVKKLSGEYTIGVYTGAPITPGTEPTGLIRFTVASNASIYYVDLDGVIEEITLDDVATDWNDQIMYTVDEGELTNIFIQEVKD